MKFRITLAALFLATAAHAGTQNCAEGANGCTYQDGSLTKGETTNSQTIGDTQHNTYAPDSATSTASNSTKIGDTITVRWGDATWTNVLTPDDFYRAADVLATLQSKESDNG